MATVIRLNVSCTEDAAKALRNSNFRVMCPSETILAVTVVPILAPMIMGMAPFNPREPLLTIPTIRDVVVEELWKRTVARIPIKSATNGSLVVVRTAFAKPPPICLMAEDMPFIPTRKR